jgi:hypothetical protein
MGCGPSKTNNVKYNNNYNPESTCIIKNKNGKMILGFFCNIEKPKSLERISVLIISNDILLN